MQLLHGDSLEVLKTLPDNSVDSVVTDPPYGKDFQSRWNPNKSKRKAKIANDKKPFIWFLYDAYRVLKDGGAMLCFSDWKNQESWRLALEIAGFKIKSHIIWDKGIHGMGDLKSAFGPKHEVVWHAVKGNFSFPGMRPQSVLSFKKETCSSNALHPNQKPVELMQSLIASVTPPNGTVLDPFMGSGSTGVAAKNLGMHFIGIEKDAEYFEIMQARVS